MAPKGLPAVPLGRLILNLMRMAVRRRPPATLNGPRIEDRPFRHVEERNAAAVGFPRCGAAGYHGRGKDRITTQQAGRRADVDREPHPDDVRPAGGTAARAGGGAARGVLARGRGGGGGAPGRALPRGAAARLAAGGARPARRFGCSRRSCWCSALFEPIAARTFRETVRGRVLVAVDVSESMATADPGRPADERARLAQGARAQPRRAARRATAPPRGRPAAARRRRTRRSRGSRPTTPSRRSPSPARPAPATLAALADALKRPRPARRPRRRRRPTGSPRWPRRSRRRHDAAPGARRRAPDRRPAERPERRRGRPSTAWPRGASRSIPS